MPKNLLIRKPYTSRPRVQFRPVGESRTKQQFKKECEINHILAKHQKTGVLEHINKHQAQYGDVPAITFQEAMNTVKTAQAMYDELPSGVRAHFGSPEAFLLYVEDPENHSSLVNMGLANERLNIDPDQTPLTLKQFREETTRSKEPNTDTDD